MQASSSFSTNMTLLVGVFIIVLVMAPFSPANDNGSFGAVSAFTTTTSITKATIKNSRQRKGNRKRSTERQQASTEEDSSNSIWTLEQLEDFASSDSVNVVISFTTFGPVYRAVARAKHDESIILGYVEGFLRPTQPKLLHLDKMEIFQPVLERVRRSHPQTLNFGGINIGLGLLMGYRCLLYATEPAQGPRTIAEFLAIDDEDFQHKRLVRYYRYAGFKVVKYVGDDPRDIPDRLVWGGCGTLMEQDISKLMAKWTSLFELMKTKVAKETEKKLAATTSETGTDETN